MKISRREFVLLTALGIPLGCASTREVESPAPDRAEPAATVRAEAAAPDRAEEAAPDPPAAPEPEGPANALLKPPRLFEGATVGLISPGGVISDATNVEKVEETLRSLGLRTVRGRHVLDGWGYLAGADEDRAADVHRMFENPDVDAILALRGGWGCNRILPLLDFPLIREHPKILMGYSDITSLLVALYARSGLVTFHGPVGISTWNAFTVEHARRVLFDASPAMMANPRRFGIHGPIMRDRVHTIRSGTARGRLVGGNLSVLVSMIGSPYLPEWDGHILFLEDIREDVYRIDRMLTQLSQAGILSKISGIVFGKCTRCDADEPSLTLMQVLEDHFRPLGIPSFYGSMIGHISDKFTVPVGVEAEIYAATGVIRLLEPAVV